MSANAFQITVTYGDKTTDVVVEQNMDPAGDKPTWVVMQHWEFPSPAKDQRRPVLAESARHHGWMLPDGRWPSLRRGQRQVFSDGIWILDHRLVIADVTAQREHVLEDLARLETVWRMSLHSGSTQGRLGSNDLARAAGVTSSRVRQILAEPPVKDRKVATNVLQWKAR